MSPSVPTVQQPLIIDGVTIRPGGLVCAHEDGAVVVPADRATEIADLAQQIEAVEDAIVTAVRSGMTLTQARAAHGYPKRRYPVGGASTEGPWAASTRGTPAREGRRPTGAPRTRCGQRSTGMPSSSQ